MKTKMIIFLLSFFSLSSVSFLSFAQKQTHDVLLDSNLKCDFLDRSGKKIKHTEVFFIDHKLEHKILKISQGGVYLENDSLRLVTVEHIFEDRAIGLFFVVLEADTFYGEEIIKRKEDVIVMNLVREHQYVRVYDYTSKENIENTFDTCIFKFPKKIVSICGDSFVAVGAIHYKNIKFIDLIIEKESYQGESGTFFFDEDGNTFILSRVEWINLYGEQRRCTLLQPVDCSILIIGKNDVMIIPWW